MIPLISALDIVPSILKWYCLRNDINRGKSLLDIERRVYLDWPSNSEVVQLISLVSTHIQRRQYLHAITYRRLSVYKSFIQSNYSYCPVAWLFCGTKNSNKLEKLQEHALTIVFNDFSSSYEFLCEGANTLPLSFYRLRLLGIEIYKCIKETNPTYLNDLFCEQTSDYQLRDSSRLIQPKFNTFKFSFKSFRYFGAKLWNVLLVDIKQSESQSIFKNRITKRYYSDAAKALEEEMFWLPHYIISTMYLKWCRLYSNFILGFSLWSGCFLPL